MLQKFILTECDTQRELKNAMGCLYILLFLVLAYMKYIYYEKNFINLFHIKTDTIVEIFRHHTNISYQRICQFACFFCIGKE